MDPVTLDNLNRSVGGIITSLQDLQNAIASATTGSAKSVDPDKKGPENSIGELEKIMQSFVKDFKETAVEQKKYMEDVVNSMKSVKKDRSSNKTENKKAASGGLSKEDERKEALGRLEQARKFTLSKLQKNMKGVFVEELGIVDKVLKNLQQKCRH